MPNTQIEIQPNLYVDRLPLTWASNTTLTGGIGAARDSTNVYDIQIPAITTINSAINGANGLDTGSLAASTWYAIYVIGDSTNTLPGAWLISTSFTTPTLPFGYDVLRRVSVAKTDGSSHFLLFYQDGKDGTRRYFWDVVINTGVTTGTTSFAALSLAGGMPPSSRLGIVFCSISPNSAGDAIFFRVTGSSASSGNLNVIGAVTAQQTTAQLLLPCNSSQSVDYKTTNVSDTLILTVNGFVDCL